MTNAHKSVQDKINELDELVAWFQGDDFKLEDAKETLKKAADLANDIEKDLTTLSNDINQVKQSFQTEAEA